MAAILHRYRGPGGPFLNMEHAGDAVSVSWHPPEGTAIANERLARLCGVHRCKGKQDSKTGFTH